MGEWKTALSIRVRQSLKDDLQKIAVLDEEQAFKICAIII
jgi:hypothetical protein